MGVDNKANRKQQSKLIKFMKTPLRILSRTRDLYIKSMTNLSEKMSSGSQIGCSTGPGAGSNLPRSFSVNSSKPRTSSVDDELRDLIRVTSQKGTGLKDKVTAEILLLQQQQQQGQSPISPMHMKSPTSGTYMKSPRHMKSPKHMKSPLSYIPDGIPRSTSGRTAGIERIDENRPSNFGNDSPVEPLLYERSRSYGISKMKIGTTTTGM